MSGVVRRSGPLVEVHSQRWMVGDVEVAAGQFIARRDYERLPCRRMTKRAATPVRFDERVGERLASFVAAHPGSSMSSAANRLVDEGLRMSEHPGIVFRDGPTGRRAGL